MTAPVSTTRNRDTQAAAVIASALRRRNHQDWYELADELDRRRSLPAFYVKRGIRKLRDAYGDDALVCIADGGRWLYVLDPSLEEGQEWSRTMGKRVSTEVEHVLGVLDWLAANYGNTGVIRRARRYARNLNDEVAELVDVLD